ncbi:MAG TPA: acyl-CoA reductase, partial [Verrucomicrobiae bacterium]|nr:acyl-CoA reductase [Verrucomicrobiae bacterium]
RSTEQVIQVLSDLARQWQQANNPFRQRALEQGPAATGFSEAVLRRGLDAFFAPITEASLEAWIAQEFGHENRLDTFVGSEAELRQNRSATAFGPALLTHVTAGNIPAGALMSMVQGLLVRSAQFVKCASGASFLPRLFAHSLYELEPKLAACLEIAEWPGGERPELESVLWEQSETVTATGRDETLKLIQSQLPAGVRFLGYGHKVSFGFIARELLSRSGAERLAVAAVDDLVAWDQLGCLSPHAYYIEDGGSVTAEQFAEMLAAELERREATEPRGPLPLEQAATIEHRRGFYEIRASQTDHTRLWCSPDSTAWTVVQEADALFQASCLHRFIYVKSAPDLTQVLRQAESVRGRVSTVALGASGARRRELARELAQWGVTRICPPGRMQNPPLTWRHDGRPALSDLVRWVDLENES